MEKEAAQQGEGEEARAAPEREEQPEAPQHEEGQDESAEQGPTLPRNTGELTTRGLTKIHEEGRAAS